MSVCHVRSGLREKSGGDQWPTGSGVQPPAPEFSRILLRGGERHGITVLELLAASALAALLLAAVSGLLGNMARQRDQIIERAESDPWQRRFVEQLAWDIRNAQSYEAGSSSLMLEGMGGRDFTTGAAIFCRAEIAYLLVEIGGGKWLVRRESHPDERTLGNYRTELVCGGVSKLDVRSLDVAARGRNGQPPPPGSIPRKLRVTLTSDSGAGKLVDEVIHVF